MDTNVVFAPLPQFYNLEITAHCNLKCPYCPTGNGAIAMAQRGYLSRDSFEVIFAKIRPHAEVMQLFNWGEPFMHPHLLDFVETIAAAGIETQISSNLTVRSFDTAELERIVRSGLTSLIVSIDGITQPAYAAYRRNGDLKNALENLENIVKTKKRLGSETPHLIWAFYPNRWNEDEVDAARQRARQIGVEIWFKQLSCPPDFQTQLLKTRPGLFAQPESIARLWRGRANRGLGKFRLDPRLPKTCNVCRMPFEIMVINFNGDVFPCTAVTGPEFVVGNLLHDSLDEIWNLRMVENRRQLLCLADHRAAAQCRHCKHFRNSCAPACSLPLAAPLPEAQG